jgi:hypothetical protein
MLRAHVDDLLSDMPERRDEKGALDFENHLDTVAKATDPGDTYLVSADMTEVAKAAGATMPTEVLLADDLPSRVGFLLYDTPIGSDGEHDIIGVCWCRENQEVLHWESDEPPPPDSEPDRVYYDDAVEIEPLVWAPRNYAAKFGTALMITGRLYGGFRWIIDEKPYGSDDPTLIGHPANDDYHLAGILRATWRLMQQTITVSEKVAGYNRAERRAMRKQGLPAEDITVVTLRRRDVYHDTDDTDPASVDWTHRWLVDGHWRNQWLPSRQTHRLQWISGYVKGPADKPLVVKERVKHWVR